MPATDPAHVVIDQKPVDLQAFLADVVKLKGAEATQAQLAEGFELREGELWAKYDLIRISGYQDGSMFIEYELKGRVLHQESGPMGTGFVGAVELTEISGSVKLNLGVMR